MKTKELLTELRAKGLDELRKDAADTAEEHMKLRFRASIGQLDQSHQLPALRKKLARIKTVIQEKMDAEQSAGAAA